MFSTMNAVCGIISKTHLAYFNDNENITFYLAYMGILDE